MQCPFCGACDTKVIDSRLVTDNNQVRRRRECLDCKERFTTYEYAELLMPRIIKRDGGREDFNENKLLIGLQRSIAKQPVSVEQIEAIINRIKHKLRVAGEKEITTQRIGEMVMQELKELDHVSYVRFASIYRDFKDTHEFLKEIDELDKE